MRRALALSAALLLLACADDDTTAPSVDAGADADLCEEEVIIGISTARGFVIMDDCTVARPECLPRGTWDEERLSAIESQFVDCAVGAENGPRGDVISDCYPVRADMPEPAPCQE